MSSISSIAESGLGVQIQSLDVIANNIANSQTPDFKAKTLTFSENAVSQEGSYANGVGNQFGNGVKVSGLEERNSGNVASGASDVDLTTEFASLLQTGQAFKANVATVKGSDWMLQTLLSM